MMNAEHTNTSDSHSIDGLNPLKLKGVVLGGCRLEDILGRGGMGIVYKARHLALDIPVAVKLLLGHMAFHSSAVERFSREARAAARLRHSNIVGVLNVGEDHGFHFIVMEYVDGQSLQAILEKRRKLPYQETVLIARQIITALQFAYENGIVHRDIKPGNILIDKSNTAKLSDMGLAKKIKTDTSITQSGITMGSPYYIAPEQAEDVKAADHRSDIYSLGCTLFHALSGELPYRGTSPFDIMRKHVTAPVPDLHKIEPTVPPELAAIVGRMMAKVPSDRYQRPLDVQADLARCCPEVYRPGAHVLLLHYTIDKILRIFTTPMVKRIVQVVGVVVVLLVVVSLWRLRSKSVATVSPVRKVMTPAEEVATVQPVEERTPMADTIREHLLISLIREKKADELRFLLNRGVSPNTPEGAHTSPLHASVIDGLPLCTRMLLEKGANPNVRDSTGNCPLHYATGMNAIGLTRMLLEYGAKPNVKDRQGRKPLTIAESSGYIDIAHLLKEHGAN